MHGARQQKAAWLGSVLAGVLAAFCGLATAAGPSVTQLSSVPLDWLGTWNQHLDGEGRPWVAYYDTSRVLRLRQPDGTEQILVQEGGQKATTGLAMADLESGMAVAWRDKYPIRGFYISQTDRAEAPPVEMSGNTEALSRAQLLRHDKQLHFLWMGERKQDDTGALYHIYLRSLDRETQNPSEIERLMPGIYPVWASDDDGSLLVVTWRYDQPLPGPIQVRFRPAGASEFGELITIGQVESLSPVLRAFRSGERWFVVWLALDADGHSPTLQGAYSDDQAKTWTPFVFEDLRGFDVGSLSIALDDAGRILMALSGHVPEQGKRRQDVLFLRSMDRGETWSTPKRLRPESLEGHFDARNPLLTFGPEPGQVLVVWEDWREIRARPYFSFSTDFGETWLYEGISLPLEPGTNLSTRTDSLSLTVRDGRFKLIPLKAVDDRLGAAHLVEISLGVEDLEAIARDAVKGPPAHPSYTEAHLRERVAAYWEGMLEQDYVETYGLQDPFYRSHHDPLDYLRELGRIKYSAHHIDSVEIDGWRAEVKGRVTASVPPFMAKTGEVITQPEREVPIDMVWLWIDGDWYREFYSAATEDRLTRY